VLVLSLVLFVYERALTPVYGSGPTTYTLNLAALLAILVSAAHPVKVPLTRTLLFGGFLFATAPLSTYWVAVWTARWRKPILGPIVTHSAVLVPLLSTLATFIVEINVCFMPWCVKPLKVNPADANYTLLHKVSKSSRISFNCGTGKLCRNDRFIILVGSSFLPEYRV
jgi:hypothetical protein